MRARTSDIARVRSRRKERPVVITGGAGFIGTNLADRLLRAGRSVVLLDNLSRAGVEQNVRWLLSEHDAARLRVHVADVRDRAAVQQAIAEAAQVFHFASQVAVTTSLENPIHDFEVNAGGTLNVLQAIAQQPDPPPLVFTSTNKVYGGLSDIALVRRNSRYEPADARVRARGVSECRPLDFHSPYGCSKGAADQYVIDYARTFGLRTVVFRMSCIYGPHQFGTEDQGWVAHFLIKAIRKEPITIYGDGMQVRDILFADDLVDAFLLAQEHMPTIAGRAFNIGGGAGNAVSLMEVLEHAGALTGVAPRVSFGEWRPGDQRYYVSDSAGFGAATGWQPQVSAAEGIRRLYEWLAASNVTAPFATPRKQRVAVEL
ncbi:MAG: SDR family NAD(P)-dependent oxidoreductase [Gemmatimonadota bacterium]